MLFIELIKVAASTLDVGMNSSKTFSLKICNYATSLEKQNDSATLATTSSAL